MAYFQTRATYDTTRNQAQFLVTSLATNLAAHVLANDFIALEKILLAAADSGPLHEIQVIDAKGVVITDVVREPGKQARTRFRHVSIIPPSSVAGMETIEDDIIYWSPLMPNANLGWVRAIYSLRAINLLQQDIQRKSIFVGLATLVISLILLMLFLKPRLQTLQSLREFADGLDRLLGEQLHVVDKSIEITALSNALNNASSRLHQYDLALKKSEEQVRLLLESTAEAIYGVDLNFICVFANPACARLLGYTDPKMMIGQPVGDVINLTNKHGIPLSKHCCPFNTTLDSGNSMHSEDVSVLLKDNRLIPVELWSYPIKNAATLVGAVVTFVDISERKHAQEALWESEQIFRDLAENIQSVFWMVSPDRSKTIYISPAYEEIFGLSCQSLYDDPSSWLTAIHPDDRPPIVQSVSSERVSTYDREYRIIRPDGSLRWIRDRAFPVYGQNGELRRITGVAVDVTKRMEAEMQAREHQAALAVQAALEQQNIELETARLQALHASRVKSEFLANMSHEIRTPLNAIIGFTQLLKRTPINNAQRSYVNTVEQSADILLNIINDILDFSKIEAGKLFLQHVHFTVHECIDHVFRLLEPRAMNKGLDLLPLVSCDPHQPLIGDPTRLKQVLINLVDNAIKFTPAGNIVVRASVQHETNDSVVLHFSIKDTGIGIEANKQTSLFSNLSQIDSSTTRMYGGTGLGLAICKKLIEQMQGQIGMESQNGIGSTFWFTVPCAKQYSVQSSNTLPAATGLGNKEHTLHTPISNINALGNTDILVADDNEINRHLLALVLKEQGALVTVAENGSQTIDHARTKHFDVIILDIHMPVINGIEAAKRLRQLNISTLIVGLTADALIHDREDISPGLFDELLIKPINDHTLADKIVAWVQQSKKMHRSGNSHTDTDLQILPKDLTNNNFERFLTNKDPASKLGLITMLRNDLIEQRDSINTLLTNKDYVKLKEQLHKLHGSAAYCGLTQIIAATKHVETLLRSQDYSSIPNAMEQINKAITEVLEILPVGMERTEH